MTLPNVSSEGGPLLIGDHLAFANWAGCEGDGSDYDRACNAAPHERAGTLGNRILVWDIGGPGTAYLTHYSAKEFTLMRVWSDFDFDDQYLQTALGRCLIGEDSISVEFTTKSAVVLWAPESAIGMALGTAEHGVPSGDWSMGGTAYYFPITPGRYVVTTGRLDEESFIAVCLVCKLNANSEPDAPPDSQRGL